MEYLYGEVQCITVMVTWHLSPLWTVRQDWKHYLPLTSLADGDKAGTLDTNRSATRIVSVFTCKPPVRLSFHDAKYNVAGMGRSHGAKAMVLENSSDTCV